MSDQIIQITSITQLHAMFGHEKPRHPLVSVIDMSQVQVTEAMVGLRLSMNMYTIALKGAHCGLMYGRQQYDFEEGTMLFTAPNQVIAATEPSDNHGDAGWMLIFHPDLIRGSSLGQAIDDYTFFNYESHEALHLSDQERSTLTDLIHNIQAEYQQRIDNHSQRVMVSSLELLLNYCARYYERQFNTRAPQHRDTVAQVHQLLKDYYDQGQLVEYGAPSIQYLAERVHLSPNYLSDLLKKETGRSAKDHINDFLIDKAKTLLLSSDAGVSEVAYQLGFNYPHYFSRLFKTKTGHSPQRYRELF